jgi:hypothetical protein
VAVCTTPLEAGRDMFPEFFSARNFILMLAVAAAALSHDITRK